MKTNAFAARAIAIAIPLIMVSCNKGQQEPAPDGPEPAAEPAAPAKPAADYSTPEATIKTLIAACTAKDKAGLSACFSKTSEGEFKSIVEQTATDEEWTEFFDFFKGATITGSDGPKVAVTPTKHAAEITLAKEGSDWKVMGF